MPSRFIVQFHTLLRLIITAIAECVPVMEDKNELARTAQSSAKPMILPRISDRFLSVHEAESASHQLFGEEGVLTMLENLIREQGEGRRYTQTTYLSSLIAPHSVAMQKFIVGCPAGSVEWSDLRSLLRDGLIFYSTSSQAIWAMLSVFRELAEIWVCKEELAKRALAIPSQEDEQESGEAPPPTYRPRAAQGDNNDEPSSNSISHGPR